MNEDLEFVQRCVRGEKLAWDEFVDRYSRLIYKYIYSILQQKTPGLSTKENSNDIFQDIYLSLTENNFKKLKSFKAKHGCSLASWLRQVTIRRTLDYLRKHKPAASLDEEISEELSLKDLLVDSGKSAIDRLETEDQLLGLRDCVDRLDTDDKFLIKFHVYNGLSLEFLKTVFRVSRGAIDMRKARIIDRLRDCFRSKGFIVSSD